MQIEPEGYDKIAREVFAPVYPLIAEQIVSRTGVRQGCCLDLGCGGGYLGVALACGSALRVCFFDAVPEMLRITRRNIAASGLERRADTLQGNVSAIPLLDESVNLAVSRGSVFFWNDLSRALGEIYRVLAPGGWAYIGGGFGSRALKAAIIREMAFRNKGSDQFQQRVCRNLGHKTRKRFEKALQTAGISSFSIIDNEDMGLWIVVWKRWRNGNRMLWPLRFVRFAFENFVWCWHCRVSCLDRSSRGRNITDMAGRRFQRLLTKKRKGGNNAWHNRR